MRSDTVRARAQNALTAHLVSVTAFGVFALSSYYDGDYLFLIQGTVCYVAANLLFHVVALVRGVYQ